MLGLLGVIEDVLGEAERQRLVLPARITRLDPVDDAAKIGLDREVANAQPFLGLLVVGLEIGIRDRPPETLMAGIGLELVGLEAQERGAVPFGLAAEIEVFLRGHGAAVAVAPGFLALERRPAKYPLDVKGAAVDRQRFALLDDQDPLSRIRKPVGCGRSAGAGPDDDDVVVVIHGCLPLRARRPPGEDVWGATGSSSSAMIRSNEDGSEISSGNGLDSRGVSPSSVAKSVRALELDDQREDVIAPGRHVQIKPRPHQIVALTLVTGFAHQIGEQNGLATEIGNRQRG